MQILATLARSRGNLARCARTASLLAALALCELTARPMGQRAGLVGAELRSPCSHRFWSFVASCRVRSRCSAGARRPISARSCSSRAGLVTGELRRAHELARDPAASADSHPRSRRQLYRRVGGSRARNISSPARGAAGPPRRQWWRRRVRDRPDDPLGLPSRADPRPEPARRRCSRRRHQPCRLQGPTVARASPGSR